MPGRTTDPRRPPKNAILLSKVASLTLRAGKLTSSRRVKSAPQLDCVGPKDVCKLYKVDVMRCVNEGADYDAENIQWSCKATLPEEFKLGSTDVICEGYESSDDPYVLKGSCGVEYRLLLTDKGEQKYEHIHHSDQWKPPHTAVSFGQTPKLGASVFFFAIFAVVLFIILKGMWSSWNRSPPRIGSRPNRGNDDDDDPPPPYDGPHASYRQQNRPKTSTRSSKSSTSSRASSSRTQAGGVQEPQGWRPGFWTGTAAGAAAGYYAGSRNQTRNEPTQPRQGTQGRQGGWFNSFGTGQQNRQSSPPSSGAASSSQAPQYSSNRHESTGFGDTRRR